MRIIENGHLISFPYLAKCSVCGCAVEVDRGDLEWERTLSRNILIYFDCPTCSSRVYINRLLIQADDYRYIVRNLIEYYRMGGH